MTIKNYFHRIRRYISEAIQEEIKEIKKNGFIPRRYNGPSVEEIAEQMTPVDEGSMKLPRAFARNVRLHLEKEKRLGREII